MGAGRLVLLDQTYVGHSVHATVSCPDERTYGGWTQFGGFLFLHLWLLLGRKHALLHKHNVLLIGSCLNSHLHLVHLVLHLGPLLERLTI